MHSSACRQCSILAAVSTDSVNPTLLLPRASRPKRVEQWLLSQGDEQTTHEETGAEDCWKNLNCSLVISGRGGIRGDTKGHEGRRVLRRGVVICSFAGFEQTCACEMMKSRPDRLGVAPTLRD
jgi:hypothetical protein